MKKEHKDTLETNGFLFDTSVFDKTARDLLFHFQDLVWQNHPLTSKQRAKLPEDIRALSHSLTDEREGRHLSYLNTPKTLSAYVHYFLWWNLVRLSRLFANLPKHFFSLSPHASCLDAGSGPLTVPLALFIARPDLREIPLTWYCMDISAQAHHFGEDIFLSAMARAKTNALWKIVRIKGNFLSEGERLEKKMSLVTCANVFNETLQNDAKDAPLLANKYASALLSFATENASLLVVEPGVPQSGHFISLLRNAFLEKNVFPVSPCTHYGNCPLNGAKGKKWCNFAFTTENAPTPLLKLSEAAHLPKERAVLSFLAAKKTNGVTIPPAKEDAPLVARITSDRIRLPEHRFGYYACSSKGLLLIETNAPLQNGALVRTMLPQNMQKDKKTGALIVPCS